MSLNPNSINLSTKFQLHPTYGLGTDNNWEFQEAAVEAIMDTTLMGDVENVKEYWWTYGWRTDQGQQPQHKLT